MRSGEDKLSLRKTPFSNTGEQKTKKGGARTRGNGFKRTGENH